MRKINDITQQTNQKFLNMYCLAVTYSDNSQGTYYLASRADDIHHLKLSVGTSQPDGVLIYSLYGEKKNRVVLVRQHRFAINDYIYEFPAGLIDEGEDDNQAAIRELKEETGLTLKPVSCDPLYRQPFFTTIGMTDESCSMVYGYAFGTPSSCFQENTEEIEVVLADRHEVRRILREEKVSITCAHMLMHFLACPETEDPFSFLHPEY